MLKSNGIGNHAYYMADSGSFVQGTPDFPYRNYFYGVGLMYSGQRKLRVGFKEFDVVPCSVLTVGQGFIRQWLDNKTPNESDAIFFTADVFTKPFDNGFLHDLAFFKTGIEHVILPEVTDFEALKEIFQLMKKNQSNPKIVSGLLYAALEKLEFIYHKQKEINVLSRQETIVRDFQNLVHKHYLEQKDMTFYSQKLNLSSKHLSETVKEITGKSAKKWIEEIVLFEAKSLLKQTNMTIKEIVYWLGYDDPSYFNKVFRENVGQTPLEYRKLN